MSTRLSLTIAGAAALVSLAGASTAAAADPVVTLTASSKYAYTGVNVTLKISSDTVGPLVVLQTRRDQRTGPGRCPFNTGYSTSDGWVGGKPLKTIDYATPGQVVTVTLAGGSIDFLGGNIYAALNPFADCHDPATQYTRIAVYLTPDQGQHAYEANKPLSRVF